MPKYFFHLKDHVVEVDGIGTDIANVAEARVEAIKFAGGVLAEDPSLLSQDYLSVVTCDEDDQPLFTVEIRVKDPD